MHFVAASLYLYSYTHPKVMSAAAVGESQKKSKKKVPRHLQLLLPGK